MITIRKSKYEHCDSCNANEDLIDITCCSPLDKKVVLVITLCGKCRLEVQEGLWDTA